MILIFGGAYQGKLEYALEKINASKDDVLDLKTETAEGSEMPDSDKVAFDRPVIYGFERYLLLLVREEKNPVETVRSRLPELRDKVVIADDVSQGLVPMDPEERAYREACGRVLVLLAQEASTVIRVFCGIADVIK